jgi:hypothetical protein
MTRRSLGPAALGAVFLLAVVAAADRDLDEVARFFTHGRFGSSPDFGLMQHSVRDPSRWDHIATFHGNVDDASMCQDAARMFTATLKYGFRCVALND